MYQFVVAVLVPLQTLVARMCGVANESLVLLQILIGQGSPSTCMLTAQWSDYRRNFRYFICNAEVAT